jgi:hypothetical protein
VQQIVDIFNCGKSQVYNVLKKKNEITERYLSSAENEKIMKKSRINSHEELNDTVFDWFNIVRSKNFPIFGPIIQQEALEIAKKLKVNDFKASNGWLRSFKSRYNITFKSICGEANSVDENSVALWKTKLVDICEGYEPKNIADCDESALFFKALPNKILHLKNHKCSGGKLSKDRITTMLTVFADASKLDHPLIIGKSENPRCFKNLNKKKLRCN